MKCFFKRETIDENGIANPTNDDVLMIDIASGYAHLLQRFSTAFPDVPGRVVLQDLPQAIDDIYDLDPRIERTKTEMFQS